MGSEATRIDWVARVRGLGYFPIPKGFRGLRRSPVETFGLLSPFSIELHMSSRD